MSKPCGSCWNKLTTPEATGVRLQRMASTSDDRGQGRRASTF